jgi:hypothetical protein
MINQKQIYITIEWQEQGPMENSGHRLWREDRKVYTHLNYPDRLECHNPDCEDGGFEIGDVSTPCPKKAASAVCTRSSTRSVVFCLSNASGPGR